MINTQCSLFSAMHKLFYLMSYCKCKNGQLTLQRRNCSIMQFKSREKRTQNRAKHKKDEAIMELTTTLKFTFTEKIDTGTAPQRTIAGC